MATTRSKTIKAKKTKAKASRSSKVKKTSKSVKRGKQAKKTIKSEKVKPEVKTVAVPQDDTTSEKFDLEAFISLKLGKVDEKNQKQQLSDHFKSSLSDLVKFNTILAYNRYKITEEDTLELCLLSLESEEDIKKLDLKPSVMKAWEEVAMYRDLLMLGDLPTITQERRIYEWVYNAAILSFPSQVALMVSFITLAIKLTGNKNQLFRTMPGGKLTGKSRLEVVSYLAIIQTIVESMAQTNNWEKQERFSQLNKMNKDLDKIINDY